MVTYRKGGYVLHMLRQMMFDAQKEGDRPFVAMMHDFVEQYKGRNATTEDFQHVVEKHMRPNMDLEGNGKMDWFFQQWVYGTTVPRYKLEQTVTAQPGGKWLLKGNVTQSEVPDDFGMLVPIYLEFEGPPVRLGVIRIIGNKTVPVEVTLPQKPKRVLLNAWHDVLEQP
jgi:aminopeptidase N